MERSLIDLGTQPPGHTLVSATFDLDRVDYLVEASKIADLPVVLDVFPRFDHAEQRSSALARGRAGLLADGWLEDGRVHPDIETWWGILEQPSWYVSARLVTRPYGTERPITRICLAAAEAGTVVAVREGDSLTLRAASEGRERALVGALGASTGFAFAGMSAPTDLLSEALDASPTDVHATAARLTHIGVENEVAHDVASAMSTCSAHAEITSVTIETGNRTAGEHPVAFFDTRRGRILATSSTAADGTRWSSLSSGTDTRVRWAVGELVNRAAR